MEDLLAALIKERDKYAKSFGAFFALLSVFVDIGVVGGWREGNGKGRLGGYNFINFWHIVHLEPW
ncbi:hypothetical protein BC936DRAFT_145251 [Jimgerdemannia flammicorona]|uniref:Uncharacterized protein n=1 Tax=Jimgerdemannia flammicorona TaxID=994334 RepID=A0A433DAH0_9FUNG|nr:hypothetical protein BC936DRAFT_145251 [Jimgerdemannia flammicorona]